MSEKESRPALAAGRRQALNVYVAVIILAATAALGWSLMSGQVRFTLAFGLFLAGAMVLSPRSIPLGGRVEMLASEPFLFATLLAVGAIESVVVAGLCALTFCLLRPRPLPLQRVLFNVASLSLTMFAAAQAYRSLGGQLGTQLTLQSSLLPVMAAVMVFFLVNALTVSTAIGISESVSPLQVAREKFAWSYPSHLASGSVAFIMTVALQRFGILALVLAAPPVMLIYFFQRGQQERIQEQERHLKKVREINADLELKTSELSLANESLKAANKMKSEFMANMSHELRTPLTAILGFSDLLTNRDICALPEQPEQWVRDIRSSGQHLLEMINDILNLSKVAAGQMTLHLDEVDIATLVQDATQTLRPLAERGELMLCTSVPLLDDQGMPLKVSIDPVKIRQVLYNLLSNAIKFTPPGGRILVMCSRTNDDLAITVSDTGIGIAAENHQHVFGKFMQVDPSMARRYEGTGLGLALVKEFAEMHGGGVVLESDVGKGATFTVNLPGCCIGSQALSQRHAAGPAPVPEDVTTVVSAASDAVFPADRVPVTSDSSGPDENPAAGVDPARLERSGEAAERDRAGRILLIEDNRNNRNLVVRLLGSRGYRVDCAPDAEAGIRKAEERPPDLILMDINLPGMDGYEATRRLGENSTTRGIPVVALTAHIGEQDELLAYESGCAGFIRKPIDVDRFFRDVADHLALSTRQKGRAADIDTSRAEDSPRTPS